MNKIFILIALVTVALVNSYSSFTMYESLSCGLMTFYFLNFVNNLAQRLVILDIMIIISIFICLCMPIFGYHYFNRNNFLSSIWHNYMRVPSDEYYSFMFPATVAMIIGLKLPIFFRKGRFKNHDQYMINMKQYVGNMKWEGLIMIVIGFLASLVEDQVPAALGYVVYLLKYLMFVGVFYCLYSDFPNKRTMLVLVFGALILQSIYGGMFGELVYMGIMTIILMILGKKITFFTKISILLLGIFVVLVIQSIKPTYRSQVWRGKAEGQEVSLFTDLVAEKITDPVSMITNERTLFGFYSRFNQGQIVSRVQESVPARFPYADGETIYLSLAASVVPRFIWPDKPESGGIYNYKRFLGITLKSYSIGLSPFGEAWGNFGKTGGIICMFFFGLLFNFFFHWLLKIARKIPSVILWCPLLFFYAVQIESDVVTMLNSFVKTAVFAFLIYRAFPVFFKLKI